MEQTVQLIIFSVLCCSIFVVAEQEACPPPGLLHPCTCEQNAEFQETIIRCTNITDMDTLVSVFDRSGDRRFTLFQLDHSSLMYLPAKSLLSKRFKELSVSKVRLTSLFDQVPSVNNEVKTLALNEASLQRGVRWELIQPLSKLENLQVTKTEVRTLGNSFMQNTSGKKIVTIYMYDTKTSHLADRVFVDLPHLKDLTLAKNHIKVVKRSMFARPASIKTLALTNTKIETLPEDIFSDMPFLQAVLLSNNKITQFTEATFSAIYDKLLILGLDGNPIKCDCSILWFLSMDERDKVQGTCGGPQDKRHRRISDINKADLDYCLQSPIPRTNSLDAIFSE